jgi:hypothetical protein
VGEESIISLSQNSSGKVGILLAPRESLTAFPPDCEMMAMGSGDRVGVGRVHLDHVAESLLEEAWQGLQFREEATGKTVPQAPITIDGYIQNAPKHSGHGTHTCSSIITWEPVRNTISQNPSTPAD